VDIKPNRNPAVTMGGRDPALRRILAEIHAGLRHGFFEYTLTCDVIGHGRRRLIFRAGKNYQFVIPADECQSAGASSDLRDEGAKDLG
jgi:hypothetical protein